MQFNSLSSSNTSDYAAAGKSAADSAAQSFAIQRKTGPDYAGLSKVAMKTSAEEKIASIKASAKMTKAGISAYSKTTGMGQKVAVVNDKIDRFKKQRMAGAVAAVGQIAGAGYLASKDNTRGREYPTNTADKTKLIDDYKAANKTRDAEQDALHDSSDLEPEPASKPTSGGTTDAGKVTASPSVSKPSTGNGTYDGSFGSVYKMAENSGAQFPALVAAQWQLESGGGKSISGKNNFFGIKASGNEPGTTKNTWEENSAGQAYDTSARFKNFATPQASVNELINRWHKDYKGYSGVNNAGSRADAARMLKSEGYATDSKYPEKLIRIMAENGYS